MRENTFPLALQSIYKHIYQEICRKYNRSLKATNIKLAITRKRLRRRIRSHFSSLLTNYSTLNVLQLYLNMIPSRLLPESFVEFFEFKIINLRRGLSVQPVPIFNVDLTAESCRSSLIDFERISNNDLKIIILSAKPKSCSLDPLPTWLLKNCIDVLLPTIIKIMNLSLEKGFFPSDFKKSIVPQSSYQERNS